LHTTVNKEGIRRDVILLGASAGGLTAVRRVLGDLPRNLPAMVGIVIHRSPSITADWAPTLGKFAHMRVMEPRQGQLLVRGCVYLAPADRHLIFRSGWVQLDSGAKRAHSRPAADVLFTSAASAYAERVVAVVLTGRGRDGAEGLRMVSKEGGLALVQKPDEAMAPSMPNAAIARDHVRGELLLAEIAPALVGLAHGRAVRVGLGLSSSEAS
jgi:two-component system chemotaxis response regulator CheB